MIIDNYCTYIHKVIYFYHKHKTCLFIDQQLCYISSVMIIDNYCTYIHKVIYFYHKHKTCLFIDQQLCYILCIIK